MSGQSDSSSDGPSSFEALDMVLYLFVLGPAVEWCLKSERVNKGRPGSRSGIALAVCLLGLVAAAKLAVECCDREEPTGFRPVFEVELKDEGEAKKMSEVAIPSTSSAMVALLPKKNLMPGKAFTRSANSSLLPSL